MFKNKIDYKLINIAIFIFIITLMYLSGNLWLGLFGIINSILIPFFIAFVIAYALYPLLQYFTKRKIPKSISLTIIIAIVLGVIAFMGILIFPLLFNQLGSLFNGIISFVKEISLDSDLNLGEFQNTLSTTFNQILVSVGKYVSDGAVSAISISLSYITQALIIFSAVVYFLADMDKIRAGFKKYLKRKSKKAFLYFKLLDEEMKNYLTGFIRIILITGIEYTFAYMIIGHPNATLLGFLAMFANLIPYFGGMMTNIIAAITSFVISPALFIRTIITFAVLSTIDGYVINPFVYGKTNKVHPIVVILSVFAGGKLFGIIGIIISLPLSIIIIATYKFFKDDISEKIEDIRNIK
ncbi:MAG: AI-2E family transporter [Bacilli bacterium]